MDKISILLANMPVDQLLTIQHFKDHWRVEIAVIDDTKPSGVGVCAACAAGSLDTAADGVLSMKHVEGLGDEFRWIEDIK